MTLHEFPGLVQGSDDWLAARRGIVTASTVGRLLTTRTLDGSDYYCPACEADPGDPCRSKVKRGGETGAAIKTLHPERTAVAAERRAESPLVVEVANTKESQSLTALLVAERITGWTEDVYVSDDMWRGIDDEPRARDRYSETYAPVTQSGFMVRDDSGYKIGYSPDGLVGDDGLIEVKSRRPKNHIATVLADAVPVENMAQIQCGLYVSGRHWCDYISYAGGMAMWVKRVYSDPDWWLAIIAAVTKFEAAAAEMIATYKERTAGLPMTARTNDEIEV